MEEKEKERIANLTPEEKLAEKLRLQKIQEENDLRVAMDTFGVSAGASIDGLNPTNRAELTELAEAINQKVSQFKEMEDFAGFLEELTRSICSSREYLAYARNLHCQANAVDCVPNAPRSSQFDLPFSSCRKRYTENQENRRHSVHRKAKDGKGKDQKERQRQNESQPSYGKRRCK